MTTHVLNDPFVRQVVRSHGILLSHQPTLQLSLVSPVVAQLAPHGSVLFPNVDLLVRQPLRVVHHLKRSLKEAMQFHVEVNRMILILALAEKAKFFSFFLGLCGTNFVMGGELRRHNSSMVGCGEIFGKAELAVAVAVSLVLD